MAKRKTVRRTRQLVKTASSASRKREMTGINNEARKKDIATLHERLDNVMREFRLLEARVENIAQFIKDLGKAPPTDVVSRTTLPAAPQKARHQPPINT